jgi:hypothetical protein
MGLGLPSAITENESAAKDPPDGRTPA